MTEAMAPPGASFLATRKGQLTLAFLCLVAFMDFMGFAIMTVALPTIQRDLHFSPAEPAMGHQRLHRHLRRVPAARRAAGRPARAAGDAGHRDCGVRDHLGPWR